MLLDTFRLRVEAVLLPMSMCRWGVMYLAGNSQESGLRLGSELSRRLWRMCFTTSHVRSAIRCENPVGCSVCRESPF